MEKNQIILLGITAVCVGLLIYNNYCQKKIDKENKWLKLLPIFGGGLYTLKFIVDLAAQ